MSIRQVLAVIWARRWTAITVLLATVLTAALVVSLVPRRYQAAAQVLVNTTDPDPVTNTQISPVLARGYIYTVMETIKTPGVAVRVVDALGLADEPAYQRAFKEATDGRGDIRDWIGASLLTGVEVARVAASDIVSITYRSRNPDDAARFANAFAAAYLDNNVEMRVLPARNLLPWYEERIEALQKRLAEVQGRRADLRRLAGDQGSTDGLPNAAAGLADQVKAAQSEVNQAQFALDQARSGKAQIQNNRQVEQLRKQIDDIDLDLSQANRTLDPTHRRIRVLRDQRAAVAAQLDLAEKRASAEAVSENERRVAEAERRLADLKASASGENRLTRDQLGSRSSLLAAEREIEALQNQIDTTLQRREKLRLESNIDRSQSSLLSRAAVPSSPSFPRVPLTLAVAGGLGLAFGVGLAFLREMLDRRVRCPDDLAALGDVRLLAVIPKARIRRRWGSRNRSRSGRAPSSSLASPVRPRAA